MNQPKETFNLASEASGIDFAACCDGASPRESRSQWRSSPYVFDAPRGAFQPCPMSYSSSGVTPKPAIDGHFKTGQ